MVIVMSENNDLLFQAAVMFDKYLKYISNFEFINLI